MQLLKEKFTPTTSSDTDEDEEVVFGEWFITDSAKLVRSLLDEREFHTLPEKGKGKAAEGHEEEDYWLVPSDEEAPATEPRRTNLRGEGKTTYLAAVAGWLVYALSSAAAPQPVDFNQGKKRKRSAVEEESIQAFVMEDPAARVRVVRDVVGTLAGEMGVRVVRDAVAVYEGRLEGDSAGPRCVCFLVVMKASSRLAERRTCLPL